MFEDGYLSIPQTRKIRSGKFVTGKMLSGHERFGEFH
jgi:hypothetical protein